MCNPSLGKELFKTHGRFTPTRRAIIQKMTVTSVVKDVERSEPSYVYQLWEKVWQLLKMLNIESSYDPAVVLKKNENIHPSKNLYMDMHSTIIYNGPKLETTQMSIS